MSTAYPPPEGPAARDESGQEVPQDGAGGPAQPAQPYSAVQDGSGQGDTGQSAGHIPLPTFGQQPGYGEQPPPAYGQQPPPAYGQQPPPAYGQQPTAYGEQPPTYRQQPWGGLPETQWDNSAYGTPAVGVLPKEAYASWGQRVGAYLIDFGAFLVATIIATIIIAIGAARSTPYDRATGTPSDVDPLVAVGSVLLVLVMIVQLAFTIWNRWLRAGRTGMSLGKQRMGIKLVGLESGAPIGAGKAFLRDLVRGLLGNVPIVPLIDVLFPLWDDKRQTLTDKIMSTVVVKNQ